MSSSSHPSYEDALRTYYTYKQDYAGFQQSSPGRCMFCRKRGKGTLFTTDTTTQEMHMRCGAAKPCRQEIRLFKGEPMDDFSEEVEKEWHAKQQRSILLALQHQHHFFTDESQFLSCLVQPHLQECNAFEKEMLVPSRSVHLPVEAVAMDLQTSIAAAVRAFRYKWKSVTEKDDSFLRSLLLRQYAIRESIVDKEVWLPLQLLQQQYFEAMVHAQAPGELHMKHGQCPKVLCYHVTTSQKKKQ